MSTIGGPRFFGTVTVSSFTGAPHYEPQIVDVTSIEEAVRFVEENKLYTQDRLGSVTARTYDLDTVTWDTTDPSQWDELKRCAEDPWLVIEELDEDD